MMALMRMRMEPRAVGVEPVNHVPAEIPTAGKVMATILSLLTISVLAVCFSKFCPVIGGDVSNKIQQEDIKQQEIGLRYH